MSDKDDLNRISANLLIMCNEFRADGYPTLADNMIKDAKILSELAARSDSEDTHPATGNPIHKATYKAVKDFIDENEIKGRLDIRYGTSKNFVEKLCEIAGYYTEEDT